jgi:hypothetical protein
MPPGGPISAKAHTMHRDPTRDLVCTNNDTNVTADNDINTDTDNGAYKHLCECRTNAG